MKPAAYRNYLLIWLATLYTFNFIDLVAFGMALQGIKGSLHLTDAELGLASGLAFSSFYSTFGVAIGRWADAGNRVTILSVTRILWGAMVILTGRVKSFLELFVVRMGVAAGESGCVPPGYSLIGDHFSRKDRPRALGIFFLGIPMASVLGFFASGWLIQRYGWRIMFGVMGIPGFLLALITWITLRDPRVSPDEVTAAHGAQGDSEPTPKRIGRGNSPPPLWQTLKLLFRNATYRNVLVAFGISVFFSAGIQQWQSAYYLRTFGMQPGNLGTWLAIVYGAPGAVGSYLGGLITSRWAGGNERAQLQLVASLFCIFSLVFPCVFMTRDVHFSFALLALYSFASSMMNAPVTSPLQAVVPSRIHAISFVIVYLFGDLVGSGLGPVLTGVLSDSLRHHFGADSLRWALVLMSPWFLFSAWFAWRASKTAEMDVAAARELDECQVESA